MIGCLAAGLATAAQKDATGLPDWSGEWELVGFTPTDGGLYVESIDEMVGRWNRPPYNNDQRQLMFRGEMERGLRERSTGARPSPDPPVVLCSVGVPMLMLGSPATFEALITPRQTALVFSTREVRNIYTDGRAHTPADELWSTYWGDSIGHWEGQTLVIDTISVSSPLQALLAGQPEAGAAVGASGGSSGAPPRIVALFSKQARYTERIRLLDSGLLEDEMTVHDPVALSSAWKITQQYRKMANVKRMIFQDCEGDTRHQIVNGALELRLPQ
jgi:hypothetical protein